MGRHRVAHPSGFVQRLGRWSSSADVDHCVFPPWAQGAALLWIVVTVPSFFVLGFFVGTPRWYVFVLIFCASGAYTTPALVASSYWVRRSMPRDRPGYVMLYLGLVTCYSIGVGVLIGLATGWRWGKPLLLPAIVLAGSMYCVGLALLVRNRSGGRAMSVDVLEALAVTIAVCAPATVLWGPEVMHAEARWFALPAAMVIPFMAWAVYWAVMLVVRMGPSRGVGDLFGLALGFSGLVNAIAQTAQGVTGFALPAPPLIALNALCFSMCLLLPLYRSTLLGLGLGRLPPQAQVRGARLSTAVVLAGLVWLLVATLTVSDADRQWAIPFALGVAVTMVAVSGLRQVATIDETQRLYQQVEEASEERRYLLDQLLERSMCERQDFAGHLYERSVAAYASFRTLAGAAGRPDDQPSAVEAASAQVVGALARQAESARRLMLQLQQVGGGGSGSWGLSASITAYLTTLYGNMPSPRLSVSVPDEMALDWMTETMFLQIIREALDNVWRHSQADAVDLTIALDGRAVSLEVTDDGVGFEPAAARRGSGFPTMRGSATVIGGTLSVTAQPGAGTTVTARVEPGRESGPDVETEPALRLVPRPPEG